MKPETLLRLYPRAWRDRYGAEFVALLEKEPIGFRGLADVLAGAFDAWVSGWAHHGRQIPAPVGPQVLRVRRQQPRTRRERTVQAIVIWLAVLLLMLLTATTDVPDTASPAGRALYESAFQTVPALAVIPFWFAGYSTRTKIAAFCWTAAGTFVLILAFNAVFA